MFEFSENKLQLLKKTNEKMNICEDQSIEKNKNLIFVYCPPKVGSTSLVTSFRLCAFKKYTVFHIHDEVMLKVLCGIENITINEIIKYNRYLGKNIYVIDIYRSPIEHKISVFFEKIASYHFNNSEEKVNSYSLEKVVNRFNSLFPYLTRSDYYKEVYSIPFPESFDFERKFLLQEINGIKYIKLRLKDSAEWESILNSIFKTNIKIVKDYETEKKPIKDIFKRFKEEYKIPLNLLNFIENCNSLKYYYSKQERVEYLNNWRNKQTSICSYYSEGEYNLYNQITFENQHICEIQRKHYIDDGCGCIGCIRKRQIAVYKLSMGETIEETIDHATASKEFKEIINRAKLEKINSILEKFKKNQNKINKTKPAGIIQESFLKRIKRM